MQKHPSAQIAHAIPGRLRLRLADALTKADQVALITDLKLSPEIKAVKVAGRSIVIEHRANDEHPWSVLERWFPTLSRISDRIDTSVANATETPEVNKVIPLAFLAFGLWKILEDGALLAGESAFAIIYISFDLYWKFQQENVTRKIQKGLSKQQESLIAESTA